MENWVHIKQRIIVSYVIAIKYHPHSIALKLDNDNFQKNNQIKV